MLQELSDGSRRIGLKMNIAKIHVMVADNTPLNVNNMLIENSKHYIYLGQHYSLKENNQGNDYAIKNHARLGGIRKTPGYLKKLHCYLPEQTGVQLPCVASYDIRCRYLDTDQTSTEQTCGRIDQHNTEVCSTTHTRIERPTSWSGRRKNS